MSSGFLQCLPTPGRILRQIETAEEMEEELDSLPPPLPSETSHSHFHEEYRPGDLYDVGISEGTTVNTTYVPRVRSTVLPSPSNHRHPSTPKPPTSNQQPTNTDAVQSTTDSPLTSTPATLHPQRSSRAKNNPLANLSPNVSHIPQNQQAHQYADGIILGSSGTENDYPQPNTLQEDSSSNSSDSEEGERDLSKKSLGELNLAALDDYMPGLDSDTSRSSKPPRANHRKNNRSQTNPVQSCSSLSSSQSTLIPPTHDKGAQNDPHHSFDSSAGRFSSPGVGRRDSFRAEQSLSVDDIRHSFSEDVDHDFRHSKRSSPPRSQSFHPEPISTPYINHQSQDQPNPSSNFRVRTLLQSNLKSFQSQMPPRSAARFVPRRLKEVAEDSTELSGIHADQSNTSNHFPPPVQLVESESESISHDLTTYPVNRQTNGDASFSFTEQSQRFNGKKLNSYLHNLNGHLSDENQRIVNLLAETKSHIVQLTIENESLRSQSGISERGSEMVSHIQDIDNSIAQLQSQVITVQGNDKELPLLESSQNVLLKRRNHWLQDQLTQRDDEIKELRNQLVNQHPTIKSLYKENIELKDDVSEIQKELATKDEEVVKLRLQLIEASGQHASAFSELNAKYEQAKDSLFETQEALNGAKLEAANTRSELETRMSALKSEFAALLAEQGKRHASMSSRLKEARKLNDTQAHELEDLKANQSKAQHDSEVFVTVKRELEQVLDGKGDQSIGRSAERRVRMLISWIDSEISQSHKTSQDAPLSVTHDVEQSNQEIQQLRKKIDEFRARIDELIQESSAKHNQVQTLEKLLGELDSARSSREHEFAELKAQTDILEAKVVTQQATIQGLEVKLSRALNSTFSEVSFTPRRLSPNRESAHHQAELSKALHEINRLRDLLDKSGDPATREIQNLKMKAMEAHQHELEERVGSLHRQASALISTPSRSSIHFQSVISMRTPKTPGQFLGNANSISVVDSGDETIVPMLNQINELNQLVEQLRHQLDLANMDVDDKLKKLAEVNQNAVKASAQAINAKQKADEFETKSHLLQQRLDKLISENGMISQLKHRLSNIACPECAEKFDANEIVRFRVVLEAQELEFTEDQPADTDTEDHSPTLKAKFRELEEKHQASQREIMKQKRELDLKSDQLEHLELEKADYENEIDELHEQLSVARNNVERLENQLRKEQDSLREISNKQQVVGNEKNDLAVRLEAMDLEMRQTQARLSEATEARHSLEAEIRAIHQSKKEDSYAQSAQIDQLQQTISQLETEKEELSEQQASLTDEVSMLKRELESQAQQLTNQEKSYHRIQALLEKHANEANRLKNELEVKAQEAMELKDNKDSLLRDTKNLRKELMSVKSEAQNLTVDLQQLRDQLNNRHSSSTSAAHNEFTRIKNELALAKKESMNHKTSKQSQRDSRLMLESSREELEQKHNSESKGLLLRIRFLKLMFTRESLFRADLACQKKLIMDKLHRTETTNRSIHLALADFGLPCSLPNWNTYSKEGKENLSGNFTIHSTDRSFKSIAIAVRAICKLKMLSKNWSKEVLVKEKLKEAYKDVRGKEFIGD